mmetsp:Transcript_68928/g.162199  ORF Transcript_68928/g.162199 Transcript_68928/m.162199 type:complete len:85 (-) Transcript_68928:257-511(-)
MAKCHDGGMMGPPVPTAKVKQGNGAKNGEKREGHSGHHQGEHRATILWSFKSNIAAVVYVAPTFLKAVVSSKFLRHVKQGALRG